MNFLHPVDSLSATLPPDRNQPRQQEQRFETRIQALEAANRQFLAEIAQHQQTKAELQQQNQALRQQLQQLQSSQTQLVQSAKMSSLGQLVAGVAHEINNPINFIHGNLNPAKHYVADLLTLLHLYQKSFPATPAIQQQIEAIDLEFLEADLPKLLNSITVGSSRIREIVRALRIFARLDEAEIKSADIHEGLDSTLFILKNRLRLRPHQLEIQVVKNYAELPLVECYSGQLNQVFMNVISNAIDAIEEKLNRTVSEHDSTSGTSPTVTISTALIATSEHPSIQITIADNGIGMTAEVKQQIFDPFFTTKPIGKGTGLGLSTSYQTVVDQHQGSLSCSSTPGQGTEILIQIPLGLARARSITASATSSCA